jgi:hypothetical protein
MLDRLPPEPLLDILLLTLPFDIYSTFVWRQNLHLLCCLISHRVSDVAQPMLWKVVRLKGNPKPNLEEKPELAKHVRVLQASGPRPPLVNVIKAVKQLWYVSSIIRSDIRRRI